MPASKQTGQLMLAPAPDSTPSHPDAVVRCLQSIGFIGDAFKTPHMEGFLIGERFLQLITFMGCSPHIELQPPTDGGSFCHVQVLGPFAAPRLLAGRNAQAPRCPACRGRIGDWREALAHWRRQPSNALVDCPHCGERSRPMDLDWRRQAGCARLLVAVADVFPGEAVPVPSLLQDLERLGAGPWRYFYLQAD